MIWKDGHQKKRKKQISKHYSTPFGKNVGLKINSYKSKRMQHTAEKGKSLLTELGYSATKVPNFLTESKEYRPSEVLMIST